MTLEELKSIIKKDSELENLEFKKAEVDFSVLGGGKTKRQKNSIYGYCVGIGNKGGGKLILGVTDKKPREITGTGLKTSLVDVRKKIYDILGMSITTDELFSEDEKRVLLREDTQIYIYQSK